MILQRDKNGAGQSPIDDGGNAACFDWFEGKPLYDTLSSKWKCMEKEQ